MLFNTSSELFESEKERNLYYKIFAGYLFNDLIPGHEERLQDFCYLLNNPIELGKKCSTSDIKLKPSTTHISFDNHLYLFSIPDTDQGEFADILLQDKSNNTLIAIEAKLHSNWSYKKDIMSNQKRLDSLKEYLGNISIYPILLITKAKWDMAKNKLESSKSNYKNFLNSSSCFRVILWEQIIEIIPDESVKKYLKIQISRINYRHGYESRNDWYIKKENSR